MHARIRGGAVCAAGAPALPAPQPPVRPLPQPLFNLTLLVGSDFLARPDAWWPEFGIAVEVDSREWHLSPAEWEQTMARHRRMAAAGIIVLHVSPRQLREHPEQVLAEIEAALLAGRPLLAVTTSPAAA